VEYRLVRSNRRTVAIELDRKGSLTVRAPHRMPLAEIEAFVASRAEWVERHRARLLATALPPLSEEEIASLKRRARENLPERTARFAALMGIDYAGVRITSAVKRLGSCSSLGRISFSYRLMQYSERVIDYVVVHELAHRREMNHSARFYAVIEKILPDYRERIREMKATPRAV
jgi:predicted metal-dependent hydrolase